MSTILLLLDQKENRRVLADWLTTRHELVPDESDSALHKPFDLCIVDGHALDRLLPRLRARKAAENLVFLPVLLVASRHGVGMAKRHLWESVDELIATPIEKAELQARVEILLRARRLSSENAVLLRQLEAELKLAAHVQIDLLPSGLPSLPGFELAARSVPAREVGGDFYDWQQTAPNTFVFTVGDAMGRGMSAALLMATVRAAVRTVARLHPPAQALELVRFGLEADLIRTMGFVTLFHAQLDVAARRLLFVDAGHAHLFIRHMDGSFENLHPRGPALGIPARKPYEEGTFIFTPGDVLIIYTDGILDAEPNITLDHAALAKHLEGSASAGEMVERLLSIATNKDTLPEDDITVVALWCSA
ncbi:MAG: putative sensor protein [Chthoniobacteraceae bacterium]|nr:putative sensor protein [Chthoniobacteraceae bacterium]